MTQFDFDKVIDRRVVPALKHHRIVLGDDGKDLFPAGVADMDFEVAPSITQALAKRAAHGVFGYEAVPDGLFPALTEWMESRHCWAIDRDHILRSPNVLDTLAMAANCFTDPGNGIIVQPPVFFDLLSLCILMSGGLNFGLCDAGRTSEHQLLDRDKKARNAAS